MIPSRWWWMLADRRRTDASAPPAIRHSRPHALPPSDTLGREFPSFRPTITEPDTPGWHALRTAPAREALIDFGVQGFLRPQEALKLYELAYHAPGDALELGSAWGLSTMILARAKHEAGRPGRVVSVEILPEHHRATRDTLARHGLADRATLLLGDANEVLPWLIARRRRFAFAFVDHDHGLAPTQAAVAALRRLLVAGGIAMFHDCNDPRHESGEYGIYPAVVAGIAAGAFRMVDLCGSAALLQRCHGG